MTNSPSGLPHAMAAYLVWGLLPLYLVLVHHVPPFEFVGWRVVFTLPVCLLIVLARRQLADVLAALRQPRTLALLMASAMLIGGNWLIYVHAIQTGQVFAASLGYYINPLVNVLAGALFLNENLSRRQWLAVGIASAGVALLAWEAVDMLAISLSLACSFAAYGLVRKFTPVGALPGLTIESALLTLPALGIVTWFALSPAGSSLGQTLTTDFLLASSGVLTAVPLLLFAIAARRMDFSVLGMTQYLSPTIVFILGITVFDEPLRPAQIASFIAIWAAIALFSAELWRKRPSQG